MLRRTAIWRRRRQIGPARGTSTMNMAVAPFDWSLAVQTWLEVLAVVALAGFGIWALFAWMARGDIVSLGALLALVVGGVCGTFWLGSFSSGFAPVGCILGAVLVWTSLERLGRGLSTW